MFVYIWVIFCGQRPTKSTVTIIMFTLYYIVYIALWSSTFPFTVPITSITIISMTCILITINANLRHSNRNHARQRPDLLYLYLYFDFYLYFSCISVSSSLSPPLCSVPIEIVPDSALTPPYRTHYNLCLMWTTRPPQAATTITNIITITIMVVMEKTPKDSSEDS